MLFNSFAFMLFLPVVFAGYWLICQPDRSDGSAPRRLWFQNLFVVVASYVFYGWWNWKFLLLISFTSVWAWASGLAIERIDGRRSRAEHCSVRTVSTRRGEKWVVAGAAIVNLGILGLFKYYDFFLDNAVAILSALGFHAHPCSLKVILPVGISFYTFQALGYVIDVYRKDVRPTRDLVAFLAFVSFFPQLVAGPIERASRLLPQFLKPRRFDYALAVEGCRQMLWGFFKKVVVADGCAFAADSMLGGEVTSCLSTWGGMLCFTFQIYCDFSGYSDIAIGCSKLFGIRLMRNFDMPYFSPNLTVFWRRWHISLMTWFRDYVYVPLGGSREGRMTQIRNVFAVFLISGLWHGANWTFVVWGMFHAVCFLPLLLSAKSRERTSNSATQVDRASGGLGLVGMATTFFVVLLGWVFFRAPDMTTAIGWFVQMFAFSSLTVHGTGLGLLQRVIPPLLALLVLEWFNRGREIPRLPDARWLRWCIYVAVSVYCVCSFQRASQFVYFQF